MPIESVRRACAEFDRGLLPEATFRSIVAHAPLIAIDLVVQDRQRRVLLGWRRNPPARGYWFVPGGRVRKDETLASAFERISAAELGEAFQLEQSIFMGVYQHFYSDNFCGETRSSTHYITLAHKLRASDAPQRLPHTQHSRYRWASRTDIECDLLVHPYARAYFRG
jgi:colanic acid biosynthesis protein WcaH